MSAMPSPDHRLAFRALRAAVLMVAAIGCGLGCARADNANKPAAATPASAPPAPAAQGGAVLPGGATALAETFNDWQVVCAIQNAARRCAAKQEQISQQNKQLVLAVELTPATADDKIEGMAILPFGLLLDAGVALQIDESPGMAALHFKTCVPGGCLLPMTFDAHVVSQLRAGTVLKAKVMVDGGQEATLSISLKGLSAALDRTGALMADKTASIKH
jgi:invasion protein IalB